LKRPPSSRGDPPAKKTKQLKRPAAAAEAVEAVAVEAVAVESEVSKALKKSAATAFGRSVPYGSGSWTFTPTRCSR
jgi:hypothetical protein